MANSWGHDVRRLTADEANLRARQGWTCTGKCQEKPLFATSYSYVTGRAGRVSWAERMACQVHAERFAKKHGLHLPVEAGEAPVHAMQRAIEGGA